MAKTTKRTIDLVVLLEHGQRGKMCLRFGSFGFSIFPRVLCVTIWDP